MLLYTYKKYLIYLFASLAFSIGIQLLFTAMGLPSFVGLGVALAVFILMPLFIRRSQMSRMRGYGGESSGGQGGGFFGMGSDGSGGVKYVCLTCNNKFKGGSCPRCGSKMKRADF